MSGCHKVFNGWPLYVPILCQIQDKHIRIIERCILCTVHTSNNKGHSSTLTFTSHSVEKRSEIWILQHRENRWYDNEFHTNISPKHVASRSTKSLNYINKYTDSFAHTTHTTDTIHTHIQAQMQTYSVKMFGIQWGYINNSCHRCWISNECRVLLFWYNVFIFHLSIFFSSSAYSLFRVRSLFPLFRSINSKW